MNAPLKELPLFSIEDVEFIYRKNFAGIEIGFDKAGEHNFNAKIPDDDVARQMQADGWPVKWSEPSKTHPNPEEHIPEPYIKVNIGFKFRPPAIWLIREINGQQRGTVITERTIATLDAAEFTKVDIVVRARHYDINGNQGYKAWLAEFYGHVETTDLGQKYAFLSESVGSSDEEYAPADPS